MKKIYILFLLLLLLPITTNAISINNHKFFIPNNIKIDYHTILITESQNNTEIQKVSGLIENIYKSNGLEKTKTLLEKKLYVVGSDLKRSLFDIESQNVFGEQPKWYFENDNKNSISINGSDLLHYSHSIGIKALSKGEAIIKWYPKILSPIHSGNFEPIAYIYDDVVLPQNLSIQYSYGYNENDYNMIKVIKKYDMEYNYKGVPTLIPFFEITIRLEKYLQGQEQIIYIDYDILKSVEYGEKEFTYGDNKYIPFVEFKNY